MHLASVSGGTDILSCFVSGDPTLPVYSGEIQSKALGMDVKVYDENGQSILEKKESLFVKILYHQCLLDLSMIKITKNT